MPESDDALTPDEVWQVVHYVQALGAWAGSTPDLRKVAQELPPPSAAVP
jgi:mono/diheme cytochrome c family protein